MFYHFGQRFLWCTSLCAYQLFDAKQLLALLCQPHGHDADFPTLVASVHLHIHGSSNDLMAEADTYQPHSLLL